MSEGWEDLKEGDMIRYLGKGEGNVGHPSDTHPGDVLVRCSGICSSCPLFRKESDGSERCIDLTSREWEKVNTNSLYGVTRVPPSWIVCGTTASMEYIDEVDIKMELKDIKKTNLKEGIKQVKEEKKNAEIMEAKRQYQAYVDEKDRIDRLEKQYVEEIAKDREGMNDTYKVFLEK